MELFVKDSEQLILKNQKKKLAKKLYMNYFNQQEKYNTKLNTIYKDLFIPLNIISIILSIRLISKRIFFAPIIIIIISIIKLIVYKYYLFNNLGREADPDLGNYGFDVGPFLIYLIILGIKIIIYIYYFICLFTKNKDSKIDFIFQFIIYTFELFFVCIKNIIFDCIYGEKISNYYQNYLNEKAKSKINFENLTKKYFKKEEIKIEEVSYKYSPITSIIYIDIIESLFCICNREIICFNYPTFIRIYKFETIFEGKKIDFIHYQQSTQKLFISNQEKTEVFTFSNNTIIFNTKINESFHMLLDVSKQKIIVLNQNSLCSCLDYKYNIINTCSKNATFIQICPDKDKFIISTPLELILKDVQNFQIINRFHKNPIYDSYIYFLDENNFICSMNKNLKILNIQNFEIISTIELKYEYKNIKLLKIGNTNYFVLCLLNSYMNPLIFEYTDNKLKKIGKIINGDEIFSAFCLGEKIFFGLIDTIYSYENK